MYVCMPRADAPVDADPAGNVELGPACGNHSSDDHHPIKMWEKAAGDVKTGKANWFPAGLNGMSIK